MQLSTNSVGIPVKLLHESEKHPVSIFIKQKSIIIGELYNSEDNWNVILKNAEIKYKNQNIKIAFLFIRGSHIKYVIVPEILKNAPMFKSLMPSNKINTIPSGIGIFGKAGAANSFKKATEWK